MRITVLVLLFALGCHATNSVPAPHLTPPKPISSRQSSISPSADGPTSDAPNGGLISSFTQKIAKWFWPVGKEQTAAPPPTDAKASPSEGRATATSWEGSARGRKSKCSPCNSVPWVPIARALSYPPTQSNNSPGGYSLQVPTLSLSAVSVGTQYGPPKPVYGPPPQQQPPKPVYGPPPQQQPPNLEYGPPPPQQSPKPEYGPPQQSPQPPKSEYGPPQQQADYGPPPKPEYGPPPKPEYGPPPQPEYGPPHKPEYGPPPKPEYGPPPKPEFGPPQKPEYRPPPKPEYGLPSNPEYGPPQSEYGPPPKSELSPPGPEYGPPSSGYGHSSNLEPPKTDFGPPPKTEYGPPVKPQYGPPPKFEYGPPPRPEYASPPRPDYGLPPPTGYGPPPKPVYGPPQAGNDPPPKPVYGPPQAEYGPPQDVYVSPPSAPPPTAPPSQDYSAPHPDYSAPSQDYSAPGPSSSGLGGSPLGKPPVQYGPPQPNELPKTKYGPPSQEPPPPPPQQPPSQYGPPKPIYGPPKPAYLPPSKNAYLPPPKRVPTTRQSLIRPNPPKPVYGPPRPTYSAPSDQNPPSGPAPLTSLSYHKYLSPPPLRAGDAYHSLNQQAVPFPELSPEPLPPIHNPTNFGTPTGPSEQPKSHSNVVLTINEPDPTCNKCPPTGPDLSLHHHGITEDAKHAVANFGNLPLSDSAHEGSNTEVVHVRQPNFTASHQVEVTKSIPLSEYLSSIEYPMQIVQAPILDVPDLPKYFDLSYQSFHEHLLKNQIPSRSHDSVKSSAQNSATRYTNPPPVSSTSPVPPPSFSSPTTHQPRQYFNTHSATENSTFYETIPLSTAWGNAFPSTLSISARPFVPSTTPRSPKQTGHIHQIIVPYTTARKPVQARKVPPTSTPDLEAIYVNRGVSAPDSSAAPTTVNHPLAASSSEQLENIDHVNALTPDTISKLVQISQNDNTNSGLKHILATDIRALLEGEQDSVDLSRLQKNIDKWTVEGFGRRETIPQQTSKKIPDYFFTTPTPQKSDHDTAASHHYPIYFKANPSTSRETTETDDLTDTAFMHEMYGWSLLDTQLKNETPQSTTKTVSISTATTSTTTQKPWEELEVSISPLTKEKVYVVTPQTIQQESGPTATNSSTIKYEQSSRVTRQLTAPDKRPIESTENVEVVTPTNKRDNKELETNDDMIPEVPAMVTYIGSASSLRHSSVQFSQSSSSSST